MTCQCEKCDCSGKRMREIKYQAFLKDEKRMVQVMSIDFRYGTIGWYETPSDVMSGIESDAFLDTVQLRQYTGLKDKTGKEIYEGDILQDYTKNGQQISKVVVYWNDGFWDGETLPGERYKLCYAGFKRAEVIGNIYDNPELLKDGEADVP